MWLLFNRNLVAILPLAAGVNHFALRPLNHADRPFIFRGQLIDLLPRRCQKSMWVVQPLVTSISGGYPFRARRELCKRDGPTIPVPRNRRVPQLIPPFLVIELLKYSAFP